MDGKIQPNYARLVPMLICCMFFSFSITFSRTYPQAFEDPLIRYFKVGTVDIQFLNVLYNATNAILALGQGFLISRLKYGLSMVLASILIYIGSLIIFMSIREQNFEVMLIGRIIFSLSGEICFNVTMAVINERYIGSFTTIAMMLCYMAGRVVTGLASFYQPQLLIDHRSLELPFFVMTLGSFIQFFFSFIFYIFYDRMTDEEKLAHGSNEIKEISSTFTWSHLRTLNVVFLCTLVCYTFIPIVFFTMAMTSTDLFMNRFGYSYQEAKNFLGIINSLQIILMPISAYVLQKYGYKSLSMVFGSILSICGILLLVILDSKPTILAYVAIVLLAAYFSLYGPAIGPCMSMSLPKDSVGVGLSIATVFQQIALALTPYVIGWLSKERDIKSYQRCLYFMLTMSVIGFIFALLTFILDYSSGKLLHLPENSLEVSKLRAIKNLEFRTISESLNKNSFLTDPYKDKKIINENDLISFSSKDKKIEM